MSQNLTITNGSPRSIHPGFRDASGGVVPFTPEQIPQHCPLFATQTPGGEEGVVLTTGADLMETHGKLTFDQRGKFYSHQTHGMARCNAEGNLFFHKRLVEQTAKAASAVFWLEIVVDKALPYKRDVTGAVQTVNGVKQTEGVIGTDEVDVIKFRWTVEELPAGKTVKELTSVPGTLTSSVVDAEATKYPIFGMEFNARGAIGSDYGIEIMLPHEKSSSPGDLYAMEYYKANIYRARVMKRDNPRVSPSVVQTVLGMQFVDLPFGEEILNERTNRLYTNESLIEDFESNVPGSIPRPAPFKNFEINQAYIDTIQEQVALLETTLSGETVEPREVNIFNEFNIRGVDQHAIRFTNDSAVLKANNVHYLKGGSDGIVNETILNTLMTDFLRNQFDDPKYPLRDIAQFPFTDLYDTGFDVDTKYEMLAVMGKRPDVFVTVCTQDLALPDNDTATELAMASGLYSTARLIPESVLYGTPACRALITGQMGRVTSNDHIKRPRYPLVMDLITKRSRYTGAADGKMKSGQGYDEGTNRYVENFDVKTVTQTWKPEAGYFADWDSGLNTVRFINRSTLYWPALQTVYSNDTSVLNSDINVHICCDVVRRQHLTWASLSGNGKLNIEQYLAESIRIMTDLVANRYDERVTFVIDAYQTAADAARGYSYEMNATMYLNNMVTVATMNITARRSSELLQAA